MIKLPPPRILFFATGWIAFLGRYTYVYTYPFFDRYYEIITPLVEMKINKYTGNVDTYNYVMKD